MDAPPTTTDRDLTPAPRASERTPGRQGRRGGEGRPPRYFVYCRKSSEAEDRQVQSIESQRTELQRILDDQGLDVVGVFEEAQSAKQPGRPLFTDMMRRLEAGEANGIVAWAPDRLARNSIDGGRLIYLLDTGALRDLKFATYTFENNSQGKFMLQIMFGQSKYYSDALSDMVKRGNRTKAEKGWRPNAVPLGYQNDPATKTIVVDPAYAPLVRRIFDLALTGGYSARRIARIARDDWAFRTPVRRRRGGKPMPPNSVLQLLQNPFYAGHFTWAGETYAGAHTPLVTPEEFARVQTLVGRRRGERRQRYSFPLTGVIRCGSCDRAVTAEHKTNRHGHRYIYYHCAKTGFGRPCREPSVRSEALLAQVEAGLARLATNAEIADRLLRLFKLHTEKTRLSATVVRENVEKRLREVQSQITELTRLRISGVIPDDEFLPHRKSLHDEAAQLARELDRAAQPDDLFEPACDLISFGNQAVAWFRMADDDTKRLIVKTACSNPTLTNKILSFDAADWWRLWARFAARPCQLAGLGDVRTPDDDLTRIFDELAEVLRSEDGQRRLASVRAIRALMSDGAGGDRLAA